MVGLPGNGFWKTCNRFSNGADLVPCERGFPRLRYTQLTLQLNRCLHLASGNCVDLRPRSTILSSSEVSVRFQKVR